MFCQYLKKIHNVTKCNKNRAKYEYFIKKSKFLTIYSKLCVLLVTICFLICEQYMHLGYEKISKFYKLYEFRKIFLVCLFPRAENEEICNTQYFKRFGVQLLIYKKEG